MKLYLCLHIHILSMSLCNQFRYQVKVDKSFKHLDLITCALGCKTLAPSRLVLLATTSALRIGVLKGVRQKPISNINLSICECFTDHMYFLRSARNIYLADFVNFYVLSIPLLGNAYNIL